MTSSPATCPKSIGNYEVWLYARPDYRQPLQETGFFHGEDACERVAAAVRIWLHENVWCEEVLGPALDTCDRPEFPGESRECLLNLPHHLRRGGIDPALVLVDAKLVTLGDSAAGPDAADAFRDDDTVEFPIEIVWRPESEGGADGSG